MSINFDVRANNTDVFNLPGSLLAAALTSFTKKLPSSVTYLQLKAAAQKNAWGNGWLVWQKGLVKPSLDLGLPRVILVNIFPDCKTLFLSYNCIYSRIIWSINLVITGLFPLINKTNHSFLLWRIFLMCRVHGLHKGIASFFPPPFSPLVDGQSALFHMIKIMWPNINIMRVDEWCKPLHRPLLGTHRDT